MDDKSAHPETSLDVNLMILDYFLFATITAVLRDRDAQRRDGIYTENTQRLLTTFTGKSSRSNNPYDDAVLSFSKGCIHVPQLTRREIDIQKISKRYFKRIIQNIRHLKILRLNSRSSHSPTSSFADRSNPLGRPVQRE